MTQFKAILAAILFVGITALKFYAPDTAASLRAALLPAINESVDYRAAAVRLGENLTEGKNTIAVLLRGEWPDRKEPKDTDEEVPEVKPTPDPAMLREIEKAFSLPLAETSSEAPEAVPVAAYPDASSDTPAVSKAMEAFLESQKEYADLEIPANVSYEIPDLDLDYTSPIAGYTSSGFGYRVHPRTDEVKFHYGTDFAANTGEPVLAFADGYVRAAGEQPKGYGKYLIVNHGNGCETLYAHLSEFVATEGSTVKKGQTIGRVGETGDATGPHLHFELIINKIYYNPEFIVNG